jgi:DNA-directed RNA polymerase III subunit RPC4
MNVDAPSTTPKRVTFAPDSKPAQPESSTASTPVPEIQQKPVDDPEPKVDGVIGQLEVHQSGAVKMRLKNGIVMDVRTTLILSDSHHTDFIQVAAATQPSFLQHAAYLDMPSKRLSVLGEVNKRFIVSPNIEALLSAMDIADRDDQAVGAAEDLTRMDIA